MGIGLFEIGVKMRKGAIFTIKGCFRSVCNHPFLVCVLCFLICLYRFSPFIFSLLVSASPVLVCTAVLLGTLLSFGQPNIPEIEIEERTTKTHEAVPLRTGVSGDASIVEKNDSFYVERYSERGRDEVEPSSDNFSEGKIGEVHLDDTAPLIEERSRESDVKKGKVSEGNEEFPDMMFEQKAEWNEGRFSDGEILENHYASIPKIEEDGENLESDDEKSMADSFDSERVNVDSLDSPPRSPWKRVEDREEEEDEEEDGEEEDEDEDGLDSGSDRAESSSPDASMADIMPMLDELHPLLDEDVPQPARTSREGSDVESEDESSGSSTSSSESDDEDENQEELEVAENDEDEEGQEDKEERTKSAITWTEEDERNLMDLGSSELERNQRLENLILRRRARKNMSMVPERNLIDLESWDLPFGIPPISTSRQNPFDVPNDSHDINSGLPPIPGSAPSILSQRRNPFDIPYDSSEEKPNLVGDGFVEDFTAQSREPFFKRHESFNVGPSIFGPNRHDARLRPYFVPERMASDESGYSPFQRQSSELSESKVSSVPETESLGSVEDLEDRKLVEEDNSNTPSELEATSRVAEIDDSIVEVNEEGPPELTSKNEEAIDEEEEDVPCEPEVISNMEHVSEHIGHGSQSSEDEEEETLESEHVEKRTVEVDELENHSNSETSEKRYSREDSSSSSFSEASERVFTETELMLERRRNDISEEIGISSQASIESTTLVVDIPPREPVYDSSPPAVRKNFSSSSISSDIEPETSLPPVLVKRTVSFIERESKGSSSREVEKDISVNDEVLSEIHPVNEHDSRDDTKSDILRVERTSDSESTAAELSVMSHEPVCLDEHKENEIPSLSSDKNVDIFDKSSEGQNLSQSTDSTHSSVSEVNVVQIGGQMMSEQSIEKEETIQTAESQTQSPISISDEHEQNEIPVSDKTAEPADDRNLGKSMDDTKSDFLGVDQTADSESTSPAHSATGHQPVSSISAHETLETEILMDEHRENEIPALSSDKNVDILEMCQNISQSTDNTLSPVSEVNVVQVGGHMMSEQSIDKEETIQTTENQTQSPNSVSDQYEQNEIPVSDKNVEAAGDRNLGKSLDETKSDFLGVDHTPESESTSAVLAVTSHKPVSSTSSLEGSEEEILVDEHKDNEIPTSSSDKNVDIQDKSSKDLWQRDDNTHSAVSEVNVVQFGGQMMFEQSIEKEETVETTESQTQSPNSISDQYERNEIPVSYNESADDRNLGESSEVDVVRVSVPPLRGPLTAEQPIEKEEAISTTVSQTQSPSSDSDVYLEAQDKLISTPSAEGNAAFSVFSDKPMHEPTFKHLGEVKAPKASVEPSDEVRTPQDDANMPVVQELENDITSNVNSPLSPDFISIPSSAASEGAGSNIDMETIVEVAEEIKEIDEGLLSELDSVGDFSINNRWESEPSEYEEQGNSIGGNFSSSQHAESSSVRILEVNTIQENKIENSDNLREEIDVCEEDMEGFSEMQTSGTSIAEHIDISNKEFNERDGQDSPDQETFQEESLSEKNESSPKEKVHSLEDFDLVSKENESSPVHGKEGFVETEVMTSGVEISHQSQVDREIPSEIREIEARGIEDMDLALKEEEIEKPVVLEPSREEVVIGEAIAENSETEKINGNSSSMNFTSETSILEIEDSTSDHKQVSDISRSHIVHVVDSGETGSPSSEMPVEEPIPSEITSLPQKQVPSVHIEEGSKLEGSKQDFSDGLGAVEEEKVSLPVEKESSVKDMAGVSSEKPDEKVKEPEDHHETTKKKGKKKVSKGSSSSSSSSSSSESSSSDSD